MPCLGQTLMKKFVSLGNECVEFLKAARSSHGKLFAILCLLFAYLCAFVTLLLSFLSSSCAADDLAVANARVSSLKAELEASRKAWEAATASKTTAEKSTKSALSRAKKAEKALDDANKECIQREQAVTECLNKMSALAGGKYHALPFFVELQNSYTC
jgi:phage-related minor tail protein